MVASLLGDLEVEDALKTGVSRGEFLSAMRAWLTERQEFEALQLLAAALSYKGSHRDLSALRIYESMRREAVGALMTDVTFAVKRRTPD